MTSTRETLRATLTKRMHELETELDDLHTQEPCGPKTRIAIACEMLEDEVNEEIRRMYIETSASANEEYTEKEVLKTIRQIL
jgi:hypothetical protein